MRFLPLLLTLLACHGVGAPDFVSSRGVSYRYDFQAIPWDPAQIEAQEAGFVGALEDFTYFVYPPVQVSKALSKAQVAVVPDAFPCGIFSDAQCNGLEYDEQIEVRRFDCPAQSALTHELAHWIRQAVRGDPDIAHTDTNLWQAANAHYEGGCSE